MMERGGIRLSGERVFEGTSLGGSSTLESPTRVTIASALGQSTAGTTSMES
jgi:hypothetical protein